jgi:hypothetical protein
MVTFACEKVVLYMQITRLFVGAVYRCLLYSQVLTLLTLGVGVD